MKNSLNVSNLPADFRASMLEDLFAMIGDVRMARVELDTRSGLNRGFVEMSTPAEAQDCIHYFNGQTRQGFLLEVTQQVKVMPMPKSNSPKRPDFFKKEIRILARKIPTGSFA